MSVRLVYVCDRCSNVFHARRAEKCTVCASTALWEYPPEREHNATQHALDIRHAPTPQGRKVPS